jgi:hypothetical protein
LTHRPPGTAGARLRLRAAASDARRTITRVGRHRPLLRPCLIARVAVASARAPRAVARGGTRHDWARFRLGVGGVGAVSTPSRRTVEAALIRRHLAGPGCRTAGRGAAGPWAVTRRTCRAGLRGRWPVAGCRVGAAASPRAAALRRARRVVLRARHGTHRGAVVTEATAATALGRTAHVALRTARARLRLGAGGGGAACPVGAGGRGHGA